MKFEKLKEIISTNEELRPHRQYIESLARPSVVLDFADATPGDHESRFGGNPVVPTGFTWPEHEVGEYRFLGQINFGELENGPSILPDRGILSLFYAFDEDGEVFWQDDGYVLGFYWPEVGELKAMPCPFQATQVTKKLKMRVDADIPRHRDLRDDWPFDTEHLNRLEDKGCFSDDYMLGYPSYYSLAYDPAPGPEWISLLTLRSHDELGWCWHDGDKLMVFIEREKLKAKDFSSLQSDAG